MVIRRGHFRIAGGFLAGYLIAVFVAVIMVLVLMGAVGALPGNGRFGSFSAFGRDAVSFVLAGFAVTSVYAAPGYIATHLLVWAEQVKPNRRTLMIFGALTAWLALLLAGLPVAKIEEFPFVIPSIIGGAVAGWLHGHLFGWLFGTKATPFPPPSGS